jgi:hypothetical protein
MAFVATGFIVAGAGGAAIGAAVGGLALTAYSQYEAGQSAKATANYNAKLAENEAKAKEQQAHVESRQMQKQKERLIAAQRAGFAKGGAVITEGTPLLLMAEQAGEAELDILQNQRNRAMEATALKSEASLQKYQGKQAARAANIQAVGTVIGGAGKAAGAL